MMEPKHAVLKAAAQLFQVNGINSTSIEDITNAAGIAKGAFYKHFDSKEMLIVELIQRFSDDIFKKSEDQPQRDAPLADLGNVIVAELEVAMDYEGFLYAASMDFPPTSAGPVPTALESLRNQLHVWHKHILVEAFGNRVNPYLEDLVSMFEGALNSYLIRISWQKNPAAPRQIATFITQCLEAIVASGENLTPALLSDMHNEPESRSMLNRIVDELTATQATLKRASGDTATLEQDLKSLNFIIEEVQQQEPREFLVDAVLTQLHGREHLGNYLDSTLDHWNVWKGTTV